MFPLFSTQRVLSGIWLDAFSLAKYGFVVNRKKRARKNRELNSPVLM